MESWAARAAVARGLAAHASSLPDSLKEYFGLQMQVSVALAGEAGLAAAHRAQAVVWEVFTHHALKRSVCNCPYLSKSRSRSGHT
jgi:hypothetical protein